MIQVWKCSFCNEFNISDIRIKVHEYSCSFNPKNKKCYTCKYYDDSFFGFSCGIDLDYVDGEEKGNCVGWITNNEILIRKLKIEKLDELNKLL